MSRCGACAVLDVTCYDDCPFISALPSGTEGINAFLSLQEETDVDYLRLKLLRLEENDRASCIKSILNAIKNRNSNEIHKVQEFNQDTAAKEKAEIDPQITMAIRELASTYACLLLCDAKIPVTADKIATVLKAANVKCESYWPSLFEKLAGKKNINDLIANVGGGGGATPASGGCAAAVAPEGRV